MSLHVMHEITPLTPGDCFTVFARQKTMFDFPLHYHDEFELNLLLGAAGTKRIIGDHAGVIDDLELILIGPNLYHTWLKHQCHSATVTEVTIQFPSDLLDEKFLRRNQLSDIKAMFDAARHGLKFSAETVNTLKPRLLQLGNSNGFASVLELITILHDLSISPGREALSVRGTLQDRLLFNSRRIEKVYEYMNTYYYRSITLADVAKIAGMPEASFSRFIRRRTHKTFVDTLNEIRLGHASRLLMDTQLTIAEIALKCGFTNISNFNRLFKRKKMCIPKEFRELHTGGRIFI
ncbi:AraC family transcriptional regulator [Mucilaginibacter koreensis]